MSSKPDPLTPTRTSSRIKAKRTEGSAADESGANIAPSQRAPPQAQPPTHGFQSAAMGDCGAADLPPSQRAGVPPKISRVPPPQNMPAVDPAVLEERKRTALAYAMQDLPAPAAYAARGTSTSAPAPNYPPASMELAASPLVSTSAGKRGRGRPRKNSGSSSSSTAAAGSAAGASSAAASAAKRGRGRPRKHPTNEETSARDAADDLTALSFGVHEGYGHGSNKDDAATGRSTRSNNVTQSMRSSNATSDDADDGNEEDNHTYNPLPLRHSNTDASSVYDDEYARFMRSIIGGDEDGSIKTFKTWKSVQSKGDGSTMVGSAVETMDEDDISYQLTSDEEDEDDEDEEMEDNSEMGEGKDDGRMPAEAMGALPPMILPHSEDTDDEDLLNVLGEIEGLMEEDLEAAVMASLIGGGSNQGEGEMQLLPPPQAAPASSAAGAVMGSVQQRAITTPGFSTKKRKSTTTVITTPSPFKFGQQQQQQGGALEVPAVSREQLSRLRTIMARHHQLLLQQAALSVRAAYVQKVRKDGVYGVATPPKPLPQPTPVGSKGKASLPESRLDTRSLTFCSRPEDSGCTYVNDFFGGETPEELSECLDGSVGMLQDLEQNWKDAVRNSIQLSSFQQQQQPNAAGGGQQHMPQSPYRGLNFGESASRHPFSNDNSNLGASESGGAHRPLTRSAFTKTLMERELEIGSSNEPSSPKKKKKTKKKMPPSPSPEMRRQQQRISVFDVRGLSRLKDTFSALDNSVKDIQMGRGKGNNEDGINILEPDSHDKACEVLLKHAKAEIDTECLPGGQSDLGNCLTHAPEAFGEEYMKVGHPLATKQAEELRRNRHQFTAGEDNLILRGVNLYGEKEWCLVSDRFLPDRVVNSISQRYNKLCFLIYRANGVEIDEKGKLAPVPNFPKGGSAQYDAARMAKIRPTRAPTTMNVHRWTLEEDVSILKAVPITGTAWAEICTRLMPHRDRGHIRKRYQVLERRVPKGITKFNVKYLQRPAVKSPKAPKRRSPAKKRPKKPRAPKATGPSPAKIFKDAAKIHRQQQQLEATKKKLAAQQEQLEKTKRNLASLAKPAEVPSSSPDRTFQPRKGFEHVADASSSKRPPMSPIKSSPVKGDAPPKEFRPFGNHGSHQALETIASAADIVERESQREDGAASPETRDVATLLGGFSQNSRQYEENTQMGVEKILGNDEWSQASGMQRLIEAGTAESNFIREKVPQSLAEDSELPPYQVDGEASGLSMINGGGKAQNDKEEGGKQKGMFSSVIEKTKQNDLKRKSSTAFPSTPETKRDALSAIPDEKYPSSIPTPGMPFGLDTPAKTGHHSLGNTPAKPGELSAINNEFFDYFMDDKGQQADTPERPGETSSSSEKAGKMLMSPIKLGPTTLSQFDGSTLGDGVISGPMAGTNSLLMGDSDFDAAAALKDLSNSATPTKSLRPREESTAAQEGGAAAPAAAEEEKVAAEEESRKKPRTSLFSTVKANVDKKSPK